MRICVLLQTQWLNLLTMSWVIYQLLLFMEDSLHSLKMVQETMSHTYQWVCVSLA